MSDVTLYERFTAYDWESLSKRGGEIAPFFCFGVGGLAVFLGSNIWIALWTIFSGFVIGQWETPSVFVCLPQAAEFQARMKEDFRMKDYLPRAFAYFLLSYFCYHQPTAKEGATICVLAGLYLDAVAVLNVFANINKNQDAADGIDTQTLGGAPTETSALNKGPFGTFQADGVDEERRCGPSLCPDQSGKCASPLEVKIRNTTEAVQIVDGDDDAENDSDDELMKDGRE